MRIAYRLSHHDNRCQRNDRYGQRCAQDAGFTVTNPPEAMCAMHVALLGIAIHVSGSAAKTQPITEAEAR